MVVEVVAMEFWGCRRRGIELGEGFEVDLVFLFLFFFFSLFFSEKLLLWPATVC